MEEKFKLFQRSCNGSDWYMCLDCGAKSRGKLEKCSVCENRESRLDEDTKALIEAMGGDNRVLQD